MMPKSNHKKSRKIFLREVVKLDKSTMLAWIEYLQLSFKTDEIIKRINELDKKILLISGIEDHCFLKGTRKFLEKSKNATMIILEKCGHVCTIEKYKEFNEYALNFLKTN
jgi:pimeloyl-ACP methyl ester carboxylesterase